jgi:GNAT superfamily N-acetyltransferase
MMKDLLIRKAERKDIDTIISFQKRMAFETEGIHLDPEEIASGVQHVFDGEAKAFYHLAEFKGKVIACHMVTFEWSDWRNKCVYWIQSLYVEKDFRQKGVFKVMYETLKRMVENDDSVGGIRLYVDKTNERAQNVYERLGMDGEHYRVYEWMKS